MTILDFGTGVGRIAKGLIDAYGCRVIGVDASQSMRLLSPEYVLSERFTVWSPTLCRTMALRGFRVDAVISTWVLQHVYDPVVELNLIESLMKPGALFYCLNDQSRCVPTNKGWINDGRSLRPLTQEVFDERSFHQLPESVTTPSLSASSMIQILQKRSQPVS